MSLRDPKVQRLLLMAVLCGLALWAFFVSDLLPFGYRRQAHRGQELRGQYERVSDEL